MRRPAFALLTALIFAASALAGCLGSLPGQGGADLDDPTRFLEGAVFDASGQWSVPLEEGPYAVGEAAELTVTSDHDGTEIHVGIVMPAGLPDDAEVPVILDAGPYFFELEGTASDPTDNRLTKFLIDNFVPHGYAVALMNVRGTGPSGSCMDFMGEREQADIDSVVTWLGEQDWSNGNVGMIGKSYDGSTPWQAAQFGNEHLKTIVPLAGLTSIPDLYFRNGTAEGRTAWLGWLYWTYAWTEGGYFPGPPSPDDPTAPVPEPTMEGDELKALCPESAQHLGDGVAGTYTGGAPSLDVDGYWAERDFKPDTLANYNGSVFIVHGLQDWNVDPNMVTDVWKDLDVDKKLWFGQWSHIYPDRPDEHEACDLCPDPDSLRWDFAEVLLRWFDRYLKGEDVQTGPVVWSEDDKGGWHADDDWPPANAEWQPLYLGDGVLADETQPHGLAQLYTPAGEAVQGPLVWSSDAFNATTRITGLPQLHFTVTPTTPGGNLIAHLYDVAPGGDRKWVGHAFMDLRFAGGGYEMSPVVPGQDLRVKMELFPLDVVVPEGHHLELVLEQEDQKVHPGSPEATAFDVIFDDPVLNPATGPVMVHWGEGFDSVLRLPVVSEYQTGLAWTAVGANATGTGTGS